ncbi:MAG: hypothetical protein KIT13_08975 [Burkholderiales bacterium]|nr:hypothetical protein [Burkholderiales bacterium]MCW5604829.1 hypothetical protein [Burkholderiales bacterium]
MEKKSRGESLGVEFSRCGENFSAVVAEYAGEVDALVGTPGLRKTS